MTRRPEVGNEVRRGQRGVIDLRGLEPILRTTGEVTRRAVEPQIAARPAPDELTRQPAAWVLNGVAYDLIMIVVLGFIAIGTAYRDWAFLVYLILVLALRIPSQRVFRSALLSLVLIPIVLSLHRQGLGQDFAIFAFYFMAIGVIRAIIELRKE